MYLWADPSFVASCTGGCQSGKGAEDLEPSLHPHAPPPLPPASRRTGSSRPRILDLPSFGVGEQPRHSALAEEGHRVVGVGSDQNILVVDQTHLTVRQEKEIVEVVIAVTDSTWVFVDACSKIVEPPSDSGRWHHFKAVAEKPQLESGQFPPHPGAVQRRIPLREVGRPQFSEAVQGVDEKETVLFSFIGRRVFEDVFGIIGAEVLEHSPPFIEIMVEEGGHSQSVRRAPCSHLEVPRHLVSNHLWIAHQDRGPAIVIANPRIPSIGGVSGQFLLVNPGLWKTERFHQSTLAKVAGVDNEVGWEDGAWI